MYHRSAQAPRLKTGAKNVAQKFTTVSIPKALVNHIKDRIKGTAFQSPSAFVTHVLEELEKEIEQIGKEKDAGEEKG